MYCVCNSDLTPSIDETVSLCVFVKGLGILKDFGAKSMGNTRFGEDESIMQNLLNQGSEKLAGRLLN